MQQISLILSTFSLPKTESEYKNKRDQIIKEAVKHINSLRVGTPYEKKIETPAKLAKRCNMNPFLKNTDELEMVITKCREKNNYSYLYLLIKTK